MIEGTIAVVCVRRWEESRVSSLPRFVGYRPETDSAPLNDLRVGHAVYCVQRENACLKLERGSRPAALRARHRFQRILS
jgi:hypothetical protein